LFFLSFFFPLLTRPLAVTLPEPGTLNLQLGCFFQRVLFAGSGVVEVLPQVVAVITPRMQRFPRMVPGPMFPPQTRSAGLNPFSRLALLFCYAGGLVGPIFGPPPPCSRWCPNPNLQPRVFFPLCRVFFAGLAPGEGAPKLGDSFESSPPGSWPLSPFLVFALDDIGNGHDQNRYFFPSIAFVSVPAFLIAGKCWSFLHEKHLAAISFPPQFLVSLRIPFLLRQ